MTVDRSREDKGRAYYTRMEGKKERKMIGGVILLQAPDAPPQGQPPSGSLLVPISVIYPIVKYVLGLKTIALASPSP